MPEHPSCACLDAGERMFKISVDATVYEFELNRFAGPNVVDRDGRPWEEQPPGFLKAASLWLQQGRRMEDNLCRWDHEPEPILKHLGGKRYLILGYHPPRRGE